MPKTRHLRYFRRPRDEIIVWHDFPEFFLGANRSVGVPNFHAIAIRAKDVFGLNQNRGGMLVNPAFAGLIDLLSGKIVRGGVSKIYDKIRVDVQQPNQVAFSFYVHVFSPHNSSVTFFSTAQFCGYPYRFVLSSPFSMVSTNR